MRRSGDGGSTASSDDPCVRLYQGLCQARAEASQPEAAREIFFDRVHQPLHQLAAEAAGADRAAAAKLLEAKQAVERDFADDPELLPGDLDRLTEATRRAIPTTGRPTPDPCQEAP
ncbi:MAG: hypothetical protein ACLGI2_12890 [Acidimicrobiia bacterium]